MNTKSIKVIFLFVVLLCTLNFVSANLGYYTEDYNLRQCRCSTFQDSILIKNSGTESTFYSVSSNLDFVDISPSQFQLNPNQIKTVKLNIESPCKSIDKDLRIRVQSNKGDNQIIEKQLVLGQCQNLQTRLFADKSVINPCEDVNYKLYLKNTGSFTENYSIYSNQGNYMNISSTELILESGEEEYVDATLSLSCDLFGDYLVNFQVTAEKNNLVSSMNHVLNISDKYDYSVDVEDSYDICEEKTDSILINIENEVSIPNTYYLSLVDAPSFLSLSSNNISLDASEDADVDFLFNIEEDKSIGEYNFTLHVESEYGHLVVDKDITLNIDDCYNLDIKILNKYENYCSGEQTLTVEINNFGVTKESVRLSSDPDLSDFRVKRISLDEGESFNASLDLNFIDQDAEYDIIVYATILSANITKSDSIPIKVLSQGACHYVEIPEWHYSMIRDYENSFYITLKNIGLTEEEYDLRINSLPWNNLFTLNESEVFLAPGETKEILVYSSHTSDSVLRDYNFNLSVRTGNTKYEYPITVSILDKPLYAKIYGYSIQHPCNVASMILLFGIIVLFILSFALKKKEGGLKRKPFWIFLGILAVLFILFTTIVYLVRGVPTLQDTIDYSKASSTYFIWDQDSDYNIPIEQMVTDPDSDDQINLNFFEENEHITMSFDDTKVIFTPMQGWTGIETAKIIASDSKGAFTLSPKLTFEVVSRNKYSIWGYYSIFCWYINLILLLINFILLGVLSAKFFRSSDVKRKRR